MWHHRIRSELASYRSDPPSTGSARWVHSMATAIAITGSNQAVGVVTGYRHMKSNPSTMSFCLVASYGSPVMSHNTACELWLRGPSYVIKVAYIVPINGE